MTPSDTTPRELEVADRIREAIAELGAGRDAVTLDLSGVRRVDGEALRGIEELAARAQTASAKVTCRGAGVEVYKVLKLTGAAARLSFE